MLTTRPAGRITLPDGLVRSLTSPAIELRGLNVAQLQALAADAGVALNREQSERLHAHTAGNPRHSRALLGRTAAERLGRTRSAASRSSSPGRARCTWAGRGDTGGAGAGPGRGCGGRGRRASPVAARLAGLDDPLPALDELVDAELLALESIDAGITFSFADPVTAMAVYQRLTTAERARLHALAAELVEDEAARLGHLAAAVPGQDAALAARLEAYARRPRVASRRAPDAAAMLLTASRLSVTYRAEREDRMLEAIDWMVMAGDAPRAQRALKLRSRRIARVRPSRQRPRADRPADADEWSERRSLLASAWERCDEEVEAERGRSDRSRSRVPRPRSVSTTRRWSSGPRRAIALAPEHVGAEGWAQTLGVEPVAPGAGATRRTRHWASRSPGAGRSTASGRGFEAGCGCWTTSLRAARSRPDRGSRIRVAAWARTSLARLHLTALARAHYAAGDWDRRRSTPSEQAPLPSPSPRRGRLSRALRLLGGDRGAGGARPVAESAEAIAPTCGGPIRTDPPDQLVAVGMTRALLHVARGDARAVLEALGPVAELSPNGAVDAPGFWPWPEHFAAALVALGRLDEADVFLRPHEELARAREHASSAANLARVRGVLEAGRGDHRRAATSFSEAIDRIEPLGMPYELGR